MSSLATIAVLDRQSAVYHLTRGGTLAHALGVAAIAVDRCVRDPVRRERAGRDARLARLQTIDRGIHSADWGHVSRSFASA
jgi:hypothetical protein